MPKIQNSTAVIKSYLDAGGKVERIEDKAQVNKIEAIKLGNASLGITDKTVTIEVATEQEIQGIFS
jgi:hypothetical protein